MGIYKSLEALLQEVPFSGELVLERNAFRVESTKHLTDLPYRVLKQTLCLKPRKLDTSLYNTVFCYVFERYLSRHKTLHCISLRLAQPLSFIVGKDVWKLVDKRALLLDVLALAAVSLANDFGQHFSLGFE